MCTTLHGPARPSSNGGRIPAQRLEHDSGPAKQRQRRPELAMSPPGLHSNGGPRVNFCRTIIILSALEWGAAPAASWRGFGCARAKPTRSPRSEWSPGGGHPGGHQTAVGGFKWASWCAASPLGSSRKCRGTGGSRVGVWGCSLVSMATIPIQTTEAGFGRPWRCLA